MKKPIFMSQGVCLSLEKWFLRELNRPNKNVISYLRLTISFFFKWGAFFRNVLFDLGFIPVYRCKKIVISVGNIALGGVGKTPFTELLVKSIARPVAILERGYRAKKRKKEPFLITSPEEGDEAYLLSEKIKFSKVVVGKKRTNSAKFAEKLDVDYIVLDDGMQHRYLYRDIEIVVLHSKDLFGKGYFAPYGYLRERPERLKVADYIIVNGVRTEKQFSLALKEIEKFSSAKVIGGFYHVVNKDEFTGKKVAAFCGIGKPEEFFLELESLGVKLILTHILNDHDWFQDFFAFREKALALGVEKIVCTEKDYVKLKDKTGVFPLKIEFKVFFGVNHFTTLVEEMCSV